MSETEKVLVYKCDACGNTLAPLTLPNLSRSGELQIEWASKHMPVGRCERCGSHSWRCTLVRKGSSGSCEKKATCPDASAPCGPVPEEVASNMRTSPERRWIDCFAWKKTLGLTLVPELGVYHLKECPCCGQNLIKALQKNVRGIVT